MKHILAFILGLIENWAWLHKSGDRWVCHVGPLQSHFRDPILVHSINENEVVKSGQSHTAQTGV